MPTTDRAQYQGWKMHFMGYCTIEREIQALRPQFFRVGSEGLVLRRASHRAHNRHTQGYISPPIGCIFICHSARLARHAFCGRIRRKFHATATRRLVSKGLRDLASANQTPVKAQRTAGSSNGSRRLSAGTWSSALFHPHPGTTGLELAVGWRVRRF